MHYLFFVTFDKNKAKTSEEARKYVLNHIDDDRVSTEGEGLKIPPKEFSFVIDWLVIGGRWSGLLGPGWKIAWHTRDIHKLLGYQDDAVILTRGQYRRWLEPIELGGSGTHVSLEGDNLCQYMADQKWLVVVDGHLADPE